MSNTYICTCDFTLICVSFFQNKVQCSFCRRNQVTYVCFDGEMKGFKKFKVQQIIFFYLYINILTVQIYLLVKT